MAIVTSTYRYKRPPRKRKAVALEVPAIVTGAGKRKPLMRIKAPDAANAAPAAPTNDDHTSAIVTARRPKAARLPPGLLPETPEEIQQRGDAARALWRELVRRVAEKGRS